MTVQVASGARRRAVSIALLFLLKVMLAQGMLAYADEKPWQPERQEGEISIYTRQIEGSPYLAVKATARIKAPATHVSQFMGNGDGCAKWRAMCKSSRVIERVSERERYVYLVLDLPWPASDRDLVMHSKTRIDPESRTATVELQSVSARHPPQDYVRAESRGQFVIKAVGDNEVEFTYVMHTDLGGNLPADIINSRLADSAFTDLSRLRQLAEG